MEILLLALLPVVGWGTWFAMAQNVRSANPRAKTLYTTLSNLLVALVLFWINGERMDGPSFLPVFLGGLLWSVAGVFGFAAADRIGLARGVGIWVPVNLVVALAWGVLLFGELKGASAGSLVFTAASVAVLFCGVLLILAAQREGKTAEARSGGGRWVGIAFAVLTGIFWGTYFIPIRMSGVSEWSAALPMALGMAAGSLVISLLYPAPPVLERPKDYLLCAASGALWAMGNYGMLLLASRIGTGRGFAVAQLNIIVNALMGVYLFKDPPPRTRAARVALSGCVVAALGGVLLGMAK